MKDKNTDEEVEVYQRQQAQQHNIPIKQPSRSNSIRANVPK